MGYCIDYHGSDKQRNVSGNGKHRIWLMTFLWFGLFSLLVKAFWDKGNNVLYQLCWRDAEVFAGAVQYIFAEVQNGSGFSEAVQGFVWEIIHEAKLAG